MTQPIVTVLSKNGCAPCEAVKQLLNANSIEFTELKAFDHPEIAQKLRIRKVPSITISNKALSDPEFELLQDIITGDNIVSKVLDYIDTTKDEPVL